MYVYIHAYIFFIIQQDWSGKVLGQQWMPCAKKIFTRATGSSALVYTIISPFLTPMLHAFQLFTWFRNRTMYYSLVCESENYGDLCIDFVRYFVALWVHKARLNGAGIVSTSEVCTSTILKWLKLWDLKLLYRGRFTCLPNFMKIYQSVQSWVDTYWEFGDI
jgi:hypothetical protein